MLDQRDVDTEERAELLRTDQFAFRAVGEDAPIPHHDDAIDFLEDVGEVMRDHQDANTLLGDLAESFAQFALSGEVEGIGWLVEEQHFRLVDKGAGDHDAPLLAGRHFADQFRPEVGGLHELERLVGAVAHLRSDVEVGPERGGGEETGDDSVEPSGDRRALAGKFRGDDAEMGAELRDVPALAAEQPQLSGGRDDGVALAGNGLDQRGFAAAVGAEDGDVFPVGDAERDVVEDNVVAAGDGDVAHDEEIRRIG